MDIERMTEMTIDQLIDLTGEVAPLLDRRMVAGWRSLGLFESIVAMVAYARGNDPENTIAGLFDVSQSTVSRRRSLLEPTITAALQDLQPDLAAVTRGDAVVVDGTLIPTSDWSDQADLFSGKHHRTGMNVQVVVTIDGGLLALSSPVHGAHHDAYAWRESGLAARLPGCQIIADLGYVGVEGITTGTRRPPGGQLTDRQRTANRSLNTIRAVVERTIAHLKNWRVLKHYRGPLDTFERTLRCVEALYRFKNSTPRHAAP